MWKSTTQFISSIVLLTVLHCCKNEWLWLGPIPDPLLNWVTELSNVSTVKRWVLLRNLKAAASYQFRVSAVNSVGEGSPSDPSNVVALPQEREYCRASPFSN